MASEFESGVFYKEPAWHKMGTVLDHVMTWEEACKLGGLDWEVLKMPIHIPSVNENVFEPVPNFFAMTRSTDRKVFAVLSKDYTPVQNKDAFRFFDGVVGSGEAKYHAAGALRGGARIWLLAKMEGALDIKGDQIDKYLLLCNGHDGGMALRMMFTPVRVVCMNTLEAALNGADRANSFYSRHTAGIMNRIDVAREILGLSNAYYAQFKEVADILAGKQLKPSKLPLLLATVFKPEVKMLPAADPKKWVLPDYTPRMKQEVELCERLIHSGKGNDRAGVRGTAWAAYNGVVEYVDYGKRFRGANDGADNRLDNVWGCRGMQMKERALKFLLKA